MKKLVMTLAVLVPLSSYSLANDSTGYVGTGGIQYLKNSQVAIQSEDRGGSGNLNNTYK
ncbi:hypothetical protein [Acinetobacter nosocomialis]|uniref:hypothetical protein n=1 Tax=Acinetobacter nosocomialis TaxID=106654 RepID=UPI0025A2F87A|nr:hypothetical protein [Acinetobacter nosocomialis]